MARTFADALRGDMRLIGCAVDRVNYRPQRSCSVSYRLQLRDARDGRVFEQYVGACFLRDGEAAPRHAKALQARWVASPAGPTVQHDAALDMLAYWLPNDPKLGARRLLGDAGALRAQALDEVAATFGGVYAQHDACLAQVVPELRACAVSSCACATGAFTRSTPRPTSNATRACSICSTAPSGPACRSTWP